MGRPETILFDVDGTLITSGGAGGKSWHWAFNELYGLPADIGQFSDAGMTDPVVGGLTFKSVIGHEASQAELSKVMDQYLVRLPTEIAESSGYQVLDGVQELLEALTRNGILLGIVSGAVEKAARIKLSRGDLNKYFAFGGYGSDSADRAELTRVAIQRAGEILGKPLDPRDAQVVGDTPLDVKAAHDTGAVGVAVATGHFTVTQLKETGAEYVLSSLSTEEALPVMCPAK